MVELVRRSFLKGLGAALFVAPAIVRASSLMPVKQMIAPVNIDEMVALLSGRIDDAHAMRRTHVDHGLYKRYAGYELVDFDADAFRWRTEAEYSALALERDRRFLAALRNG